MSNFLSSLGFSLTPFDLAVLAGLIGVAIFYTIFFVNRGRLVPLLFSSTLAFLVTEFAQFLPKGSWSYQFWSFVGVFIVIFLFLSRIILQSPVGVETFGIILCFLLAFSQVGFGLSILSFFLPYEIIKNFSALLQKIFVGNDALFYWGTASVLLLLILSRRANRLTE
jgi:hypothetical protein